MVLNWGLPVVTRGILIEVSFCLSYLFLLAMASLKSPSISLASGPKHRFAIGIQAYNEEAVIGDTIARLQGLVYPLNLNASMWSAITRLTTLPGWCARWRYLLGVLQREAQEQRLHCSVAIRMIAGLRVGTGSVIGAGSVVTEDLPAYSVAAGWPAKVVRDRRERERVREVTTGEVHRRSLLEL